MKTRIPCLFLVLLIDLFILNQSYALHQSESFSYIDTYTEEDKAVLNDYLTKDREKDISETKIKEYISNKILDCSDPINIKNGYFMIYSLTDQHRLYFEPILIEKIHTLMISANLTFQYEFIEGNVVLARALYTLGIIRSDSSIDFLLQMMGTVDQWPKEMQEGIRKNPDCDLLLPEIRRNAFGALLSPKDEKGRELFDVIEERINKFSDDDPLKTRLKEALVRWMKIYDSGVENFNSIH